MCYGPVVTKSECLMHQSGIIAGTKKINHRTQSLIERRTWRTVRILVSEQEALIPQVTIDASLIQSYFLDIESHSTLPPEYYNYSSLKEQWYILLSMGIVILAQKLRS